MNKCSLLNRECYEQTRLKTVQAGDKAPFDFSESYIFGKFDTFAQRLEKIMDLFRIIETYSCLERCQIEGVFYWQSIT